MCLVADATLTSSRTRASVTWTHGGVPCYSLECTVLSNSEGPTQCHLVTILPHDGTCITLTDHVASDDAQNSCKTNMGGRGWQV